MNKKVKKYFQNSITSILILSIFALPFFDITRVHAQAGSYNAQSEYSTGGGFSSGTQVSGGIGGYIQLITPAIQELPQCKSVIASSWAKNLFGNSTYALDDAGKIFEKEDAKIRPEDLNESTSISVVDLTARNSLADLQKKAAESLAKQKASLENELCLKSIGQVIIKIILQKLTLSTVEWINTGFEGKPLFVQDPGQFFQNIATTEILQFRAEIDNPTLYPFGRAFLQAQVGQLNNRLAQNARYSLNDLISRTTPSYSSTTFSADFSKGGWNAWTAMTQVPANNPIGFQIIASNELSLRLAGTSASTAQRKQQEIQQSSGFLGVERCVANPQITKSAHFAALERNQREKIKVPHYVNLEDAANNPDTAQIEYIEIDNPNSSIVGTCPGNRWEYVTPGKTISEFATKLVNYPDNSLLRADDLNAAIAAIMDAALNKFVPDLANKGLALLGTEGRDGGYLIDGGNRTTGTYTQTSLDFPRTALNSSWLRENYNFNIRTDLTQAVIDEQRIYQRKLLEQNKTLEDLIATVYQLDYCIPGPHPGFKEDSERVLAAVKNSIPSKSPTDFREITEEQITGLVKTAGYVAGSAIGASIGSAVFPGLGTIVGAAIGVVVGFIVDWASGDNEHEKLNKYYSGIVAGLTGLHLTKPGTDAAKITGKGDVTNAFDTMLRRYVALINKYYTADFLPTIAPAARIEFNKTPGYYTRIENNEYAIAVLDGVIVRLAKLKEELDAMNPNVNSYTDYLPKINEFARLSASMVTGNDIAKVYDDTKEFSEQIKYVYEDLLTGPYGCEKDLEKQRQAPKVSGEGADTNDKRYILRQTLRAEYPFKIWYDYNKLGPNQVIPIPEELRKYGIRSPQERFKEDNLMPPYMIGPFNPNPNWQNAYGPGFLSGVMFDYTYDKNEGGPPETATNCPPHPKYTLRILDCLKVSDLFYSVNSWPVSVGRNQGNSLSGEGAGANYQKSTSFEQTIGIY